MKRALSIFSLAAIITFSTAPGLKDLLAKNVIDRYAIVVGANDGGPSRIRLKYAVSDAGQFMNVIHSLGGVQESNSILLYDPDVRNFYSAFRKIKRMVMDKRGKSRRIEFFFYYSGHSDEEGILLGREKLTYKNIKKSIEYIPADFRIAILDSCSSGAFTQVKGGRKKPPFMFDESYNMKGNAILTSSSSDEVSQESDRIRGSFFTHYLVSGLRGAADVTQDSRITLNEAYHFAYTETLKRTEKTISGPQHPNYNIQMTGTGDVILTNIRKDTARLVLSKNLSGKFFINDSDDILVSEFRKSYGSRMSIGLESGRYTVVNQRNNGIYQADIRIRSSRPGVVAKKDFRKTTPENTASRGGIQKEDDKFLIQDFRKLRFSGYGAPLVSFGKTGESSAVWVGGKAGLIINRRFVIGGGGFGLAYPDRRKAISGENYTGEKPITRIGYGGILFEYIHSPSSLINATAGILIGGGALYFTNKIEEDQDKISDGDNFFALEPDISLSINVARYFRISAGISYRFIGRIEKSEFSDRDFSGFNARIALCFGVF